MPERTCKWCGADISCFDTRCIYCSPKCRESCKQLQRYGQGKKFNGPPNPKACSYCNSLFSSFDKRQIYCERGGKCAQKAFRESPAGIRYFSRHEVKESRRASSRKHYATEHGKAAKKVSDRKPKNVARRKKYRESPQGKIKARAGQIVWQSSRQQGNLIVERITRNDEEIQ